MPCSRRFQSNQGSRPHPPREAFIELPKTIRGRFLERPNKFLVIAEVDGRRAKCHLPNPGRLKELLVSGRSLILATSKGAKTEFRVLGVDLDGEVVCLDTRLSNRLFQSALQAGGMREFSGIRRLQTEPPMDRWRPDFLGYVGDSRVLVEVKTCTLVRGGVALFPDAPTARGLKHLQRLGELAEKGWRCFLVFLGYRSARYIAPNRKTDPDFSVNLKVAIRRGVKVLAFRARWTEGFLKISPQERIELRLEAQAE